MLLLENIPNSVASPSFSTITRPIIAIEDVKSGASHAIIHCMIIALAVVAVIVAILVYNQELEAAGVELLSTGETLMVARVETVAAAIKFANIQK
jgi:hypothetical protein